jgi:hypothetical protein
MANPGSQKYTDVPLKIAGSNHFGRYPKISSEETFNMIVSDGWLVPFAGYKNVVTISPNGEGRGIYSSARLGLLFAVIDNVLYKFGDSLTYTFCGNLTTSTGDVFITENNAGQIVLTDEVNMYVYSTQPSPSFLIITAATLEFTPGYLTFQNGRIISPDIVSYVWRLSVVNEARNWPTPDNTDPTTPGGAYQGALQTKPDTCVACVRMPGRGNQLLVMGNTVTEIWQDVGAQLFPYNRSQSQNFDYGCINSATIGESEDMVCWVAANEKSGPVIMYSKGGQVQHISNDGIDFKLSQLKYPDIVYGYMFKQDGHLFYVVSWVKDNLTYAYDFNTESFYTLTDENMNAFIAKRVAFFNDQYYFVSIRDGNLYQLGTQFTNYDYGDRIWEIPRIRVVPNIIQPDQSQFVAGYTGFTIEQGDTPYNNLDTRFELGTEDQNVVGTQDLNAIGGGTNYRNTVPSVDLTISVDGGQNFGSSWRMELNPLGRRPNKLMWWGLGMSNDLVQQFRFWGLGKFVVKDGITGVYQ